MWVATRNNLLTKFETSKWGANPSTIRTTALALSYSAAEYAKSSQSKNLDPGLNQACRSVTGCLEPANVEELYLLSGIAPPTIRRHMCKAVIIRTYISDHHAIFCILDNVMPHNNKQNTISKRNVCDKNVTLFNRYLANETWDIVYREVAQKAFTWFQGVRDLFFDKCFQKQPYILTYRNRYTWMTDKLRTQISEKNVLGFQAFCNLENLNLKKEYKRKKKSSYLIFAMCRN